jgi:hypothetical protein
MIKPRIKVKHSLVSGVLYREPKIYNFKLEALLRAQLKLNLFSDEPTFTSTPKSKDDFLKLVTSYNMISYSGDRKLNKVLRRLSSSKKKQREGIINIIPIHVIW